MAVDCGDCPVELLEEVAYCFCAGQVDFYEAQAHCESIGTILVGIDSVLENDFVRDRSNRHNVSEAWIGLTDEEVEGVWVWLDGTAFGYENWRSGQPDNYEDAEHCAEMEPSGGWNDLRCTRTTDGFVCEGRGP